MKTIEQDLVELEIMLMKGNKQSNMELFDETISKDFIEFGSSGYIYKKNDIIEFFKNREEPDILVEDIKCNRITNEVLQLTYKAETKSLDGLFRKTLRSSIWKLEGENWSMIFHQGTVIK